MASFYKSAKTDNLYYQEDGLKGYPNNLFKVAYFTKDDSVDDCPVTSDTPWFRAEASSSDLEKITPTRFHELSLEFMQKYAENELTIPAGVYYLGDPCYAFDNEELGDKAWSELLTSADYFSKLSHGTCLGHTVYAAHTMHGDGTYYPEHPYSGMSLDVDAGLLGIVPEALADMFTHSSLGSMYRVEFTEPVKFIRDRVKGIITVGPYVINTDW